MSTNHKGLISEDDLLDILTLQRARHSSIRAMARELGINFRMLSKVLNRSELPGTTVPAAVGYEPVTMYRKVRKKK
jgi:hypothetical protein